MSVSIIVHGSEWNYVVMLDSAPASWFSQSDVSLAVKAAVAASHSPIRKQSQISTFLGQRGRSGALKRL